MVRLLKRCHAKIIAKSSSKAILWQVSEGDASQWKPTYRKKIVALRKTMNLTESKMCSKKWAKINFEKVPERCFERHKAAFLAEGKNKAAAEDEDRRSCRENLLKMVGEEQSKGLKASSFPHELVEQVFACYSMLNLSATIFFC